MQTKSAGLNDVGFWQRFWSRVLNRQSLRPGQSTRVASEAYYENQSVTVDSALRRSAVWACVSLRADTIASLPIHIMRRDKTIATDHPLYKLLHSSPNYDMTSCEYVARDVATVDLLGNSFSEIVRVGGKPIALNPLETEAMTVSRTKSGAIRYWSSETQKEYAEEDILHHRGFTLDGVLGLSSIAYHADIIGSQIAADKAAAKEFSNALRVGGFVETEKPMTPTQRADFMESMRAFNQQDNAGKWMLLENGLKASSARSIRISPSDAQLLESRYFGIEEICRAYRVPPPLIGHTDKASSWASSLENLNQGFLSYSIRPTLVRMEQMFERKLLTPEERGMYSVRFNFKAMLRANFAAQMQAYVQALSSGAMNIDEVRDFEDMPPLPDGKGKEYRVPMNTAPIGAT